MLPADVQSSLHAGTLGRRLFFYPETDSTNDVAMAAAREGEPEGSVFYADFQRRGRGRRDHRWESDTGRDLLFSMVLRPTGALVEVLPVTLVVSLALSVALSKATGVLVGVKWPNDLVDGGGRKLGGILAESGLDGGGERFAVVGVGVNVNAEGYGGDLSDRAVSCRMLAGTAMDRAVLLADLLGTLDTYYARFSTDGFGAFVSSYQERMVHAGARVRFVRDGEVVAALTRGVAADGALRVRPENGKEVIALYNEIVEWVP